MRELLAASAKDFGNKNAVSFRDKTPDGEKHIISYNELYRQVRALGTEMISRGMENSHICIIGKLTYEWVLTYFAVLSIGAVLVPLDPEWNAEDLAETAKSAEVEYLICDSELGEKAEAICSSAEIKKVIYTDSTDDETISDLVKKGRKKVAAKDDSFETREFDTEALSLLVYTSGTTGKGKGVMLSQKAIMTDIYGAQCLEKMGEKMVGILPPHHTFGSTISIISPIYVGCELYISLGLRHFPRELQQEKPDTLILVPLFLEKFASKIRQGVKKQGKDKVFEKMLKVNNGLKKVGVDFTKGLFSEVLRSFGGKLKIVVTGGAPLSDDVFNLFTSLGLTVINGYGITECAPLIAANRPEFVTRASVGVPIPLDDVKIDSPNEDGEGEIIVKGPNVMIGYYKNEEATEEVIDEDGYFHTGDIGKFDPKTGVLYITGRCKNLIILSNGKNVYPEEIEGAFAGVRGIEDIVVYEGQSKRGLENNKIVAEIYMDPEFVKEQNIESKEDYLKPFVEKYNRQAVSYKRIGMLKIRNKEFPKNTLKKIVRFKIDKTID